MGIDLYAGKDHVAQWSYGGFNEFRRRLAKAAGISLGDMRGFGGKKGWTKVEDPIKLLLNHSDCDGILSSNHCAKVEPRLRKLVARWPRGDYDKQNALSLADGMKRCADNKMVLEFS